MIENADRVYIEPPEGDVSDGYDLSDVEEGQFAVISRSSLKIKIYIYINIYIDVYIYISVQIFRLLLLYKKIIYFVTQRE